MIEKTTYYFEKPGLDNTEILLEIVKRRVEEEGIKYVVVASTSGSTGVKAAETFKDSEINLVVVAHQTGHIQPGVQLLTEENKRTSEKLGVKVIIGTDAFTGGVSLGISRRPAMAQPRPPNGPPPPVRFPPSVPPVEMIISQVLRLFCQGVKVAVEIALMAADAGAIPIGQEVIAVAGSRSGADTALLLKPSNTTNFLELEVKEIIAKPISRI